MLRYELRSGKKASRKLSVSEKARKKRCAIITSCFESPNDGQPSKKLKTDHPFFSLTSDLFINVVKYLDTPSVFALYQSCRSVFNLLKDTDEFWKLLCDREEFLFLESVLENEEEKIGFLGKPMKNISQEQMTFCKWRKIYLRGIQMRRNVVSGNYEGWRIFANQNVPIAKIDHEQDLMAIKRLMGPYPKLSNMDDVRLDWDQKHLVVFHFFRSDSERALIWVFDIENDPRLLYSLEKSTECVTDKIYVHKGHVVIVPSWPLVAQAVIMTLSIENELEVSGKYLFDDRAIQEHIDKKWMQTGIKIIKENDQALVVCQAPEWSCLLVDLPSCNLLKSVNLSSIPLSFDCQQIRSDGHSGIVLFVSRSQESINILAMLDVCGESTVMKACKNFIDIVDATIFPGGEGVYLLNRGGDILVVNSLLAEKRIKVRANVNQVASANQRNVPEFQMFITPFEEICLLQGSPDVECGRFVKVFDFNSKERFSINLDLWEYGLPRDESLCLYSNTAFLTVASTQKFLLFHIKTGKFLGALTIPTHLERSKGKDQANCTVDCSGLSVIKLDDDKLIAVHDNERTFPAIVDIYKFW